jgi:hypothetical protein
MGSTLPRTSGVPYRLDAVTSRSRRRRRGWALQAGLGMAICLLACSAASGKSHRSHRVHRASRRVSAGSWPIKSHVATWAYDDGCNGGVGASPSLVRRWVSFAESNCGPHTMKAVTDCHANGKVFCDAMRYIDSDWGFTGGGVPEAAAASANWWLHTPDNGGPIFSPTFGGGYLMNQTDPSVRSYYRSYVRRNFNSDDGLLMDWQSASLAQELYYSTCSCGSTTEIRSNAALQAAHTAMSASLTHRNGAPFLQIDNSLPPNPFLPQGFNMLKKSIGVDGWGAEGEPENYGVLDSFYSTLLDQIAYIDNRTSDMVVLLSRGDAGASYESQSRRVQEATMLLGYQPGHLVDWADLDHGNADLAVWPEEGIYPDSPIQSMARPRGHGCLAGTGVICSRGGHNNVQVAPGVYRREFRSCYRRKVRFGRCAAIVNTTSTPVVVKQSWLRQSYHHQVTFAGGDVQSGGTIALRGAPFGAGSTVVAPDDALLLTS